MKKYFRLVLLGIATTLCVSCNDKTDITKKESSENPTIKNGTIMEILSVRILPPSREVLKSYAFFFFYYFANNRSRASGHN